MISRIVLLAVAAGSIALDAAPAVAQRSPDGFLFSRPGAVLSVRGGLNRPMAGSDVFDFVTEQLTLDRNDFIGAAGGAVLFIPLGERFELSASGTYIGQESRSEFRDWVDNNDLPIEQETQFIRVPLLAGLRYNVTPRGETIGSFVWIPAKFSAFVGVAGGTTWYRFRQIGDFVDFEDPDKSVFFDDLVSEGWAPAAQLSAGLDMSLTTRLGAGVETNYLWSRADLARDFSGFEPIDLSGFSVLVGIFVRV